MNETQGLRSPEDTALTEEAPTGFSFPRWVAAVWGMGARTGRPSTSAEMIERALGIEEDGA